MDINKALGQRIKAMRRVRDITQAELAERAKLSEDFIGRVERGTSSPTIESLKKIASGLGVSLKELLDIEKDIEKKEYERETLSKIMGLLTTRDDEDISMLYDVTKRITQRIDKLKESQ